MQTALPPVISPATGKALTVIGKLVADAAKQPFVLV
jgi:hypothetical protein